MIDEAGIDKSFLNCESITRKGVSITHPHDVQNLALGSLLARHFVHETGIEGFSGYDPHQSQNRASILFTREHFEQVIIVSVSMGTDTEARIC